MSFTYRIYFNDDQKCLDFQTQIEVTEFLIKNGINNLKSIWKGSATGSLCMYDHCFRNKFNSDTYLKEFSIGNKHEIYKIDENDKNIMKMCDQ